MDIDDSLDTEYDLSRRISEISCSTQIDAGPMPLF